MFSNTIGTFSSFFTITDVVLGYDEALSNLTAIIKPLMIAIIVGKQIIVTHDEPRPKSQSLPLDISFCTSITAADITSYNDIFTIQFIYLGVFVPYNLFPNGYLFIA